MENLLIAANTTNPTTERLKHLLQAEVMTDSFDAENNFVLRWGSEYGIQNAKACLNTKAAISRTRAKLKMLDFIVKEDVIVPKEVTEPPCVARWNSGSRGSGLRFCKTDEELVQATKEGAGAFLEWIDIKKEYRVHVFRGLIISVCEKKKTRKAHKLIRSASHGWKFCDNTKLHMIDAIDLISSAIGAVRALKLDFGAVDIAMSKDNIPIVFEVNTAPGLNEKRASLYAKAIKKWLDTLH